MRQSTTLTNQKAVDITQSHLHLTENFNEITMMFQRLSTRIDSLDTEVARLSRENNSLRISLGEMKANQKSTNISTSIAVKNVKLGIAEDAMVSTNTLFVSGVDGKLKFNDNSNVITILS